LKFPSTKKGYNTPFSKKHKQKLGSWQEYSLPNSKDHETQRPQKCLFQKKPPSWCVFFTTDVTDSVPTGSVKPAANGNDGVFSLAWDPQVSEIYQNFASWMA